MSMKITMCEFVHGMTCKEVAEFIGKIVRCRDCEHYHEAGVASYTPFCELMNDADVTPDGFCAWGERKSE